MEKLLFQKIYIYAQLSYLVDTTQHAVLLKFSIVWLMVHPVEAENTDKNRVEKLQLFWSSNDFQRNMVVYGTLFERMLLLVLLSELLV